jgi:hypothetical protein
MLVKGARILWELLQRELQLKVLGEPRGKSMFKQIESCPPVGNRSVRDCSKPPLPE